MQQPPPQIPQGQFIPLCVPFYPYLPPPMQSSAPFFPPMMYQTSGDVNLQYSTSAQSRVDGGSGGTGQSPSRSGNSEEMEECIMMKSLPARLLGYTSASLPLLEVEALRLSTAVKIKLMARLGVTVDVTYSKQEESFLIMIKAAKEEINVAYAMIVNIIGGQVTEHLRLTNEELEYIFMTTFILPVNWSPSSSRTSGVLSVSSRSSDFVEGSPQKTDDCGGRGIYYKVEGAGWIDMQVISLQKELIKLHVEDLQDDGGDVHDDALVIEGGLDLVYKAKHIIQYLVYDKMRLSPKRLNIPKAYHRFLIGPDGLSVPLATGEDEVDVFIPLWSDDCPVLVYGDEDAVDDVSKRLGEVYKKLTTKFKTLSIQISRSYHRLVCEVRGHFLQEIFQRTNVSVEVPRNCTHKTFTLVGPSNQMQKAAAMLYKKVSSIDSRKISIAPRVCRLVFDHHLSLFRNVLAKYPAVEIHVQEDRNRIKLLGYQTILEEANAAITDVVAKLNQVSACVHCQSIPTVTRWCSNCQKILNGLALSSIYLEESEQFSSVSNEQQNSLRNNSNRGSNDFSHNLEESQNGKNQTLRCSNVRPVASVYLSRGINPSTVSSSSPLVQTAQHMNCFLANDAAQYDVETHTGSISSDESDESNDSYLPVLDIPSLSPSLPNESTVPYQSVESIPSLNATLAHGSNVPNQSAEDVFSLEALTEQMAAYYSASGRSSRSTFSGSSLAYQANIITCSAINRNVPSTFCNSKARIPYSSASNGPTVARQSKASTNSVRDNIVQTASCQTELDVVSPLFAQKDSICVGQLKNCGSLANVGRKTVTYNPQADKSSLSAPQESSASHQSTNGSYSISDGREESSAYNSQAGISSVYAAKEAYTANQLTANACFVGERNGQNTTYISQTKISSAFASNVATIAYPPRANVGLKEQTASYNLTAAIPSKHGPISAAYQSSAFLSPFFKNGAMNSAMAMATQTAMAMGSAAAADMFAHSPNSFIKHFPPLQANITLGNRLPFVLKPAPRTLSSPAGEMRAIATATSITRKALKFDEIPCELTLPLTTAPHVVASILPPTVASDVSHVVAPAASQVVGPNTSSIIAPIAPKVIASNTSPIIAQIAPQLGAPTTLLSSMLAPPASQLVPLAEGTRGVTNISAQPTEQHLVAPTNQIPLVLAAPAESAPSSKILTYHKKENIPPRFLARKLMLDGKATVPFAERFDNVRRHSSSSVESSSRLTVINCEPPVSSGTVLNEVVSPKTSGETLAQLFNANFAAKTGSEEGKDSRDTTLTVAEIFSNATCALAVEAKRTESNNERNLTENTSAALVLTIDSAGYTKPQIEGETTPITAPAATSPFVTRNEVTAAILVKTNEATTFAKNIFENNVVPVTSVDDDSDGADALVTIPCIVPNQYHQYLQTSGLNDDSAFRISSLHNVAIKFQISEGPRAEQPNADEEDTASKLFDINRGTSPQPGDNRDQILISGKFKNCISARWDILDLVNYTLEMDIPHDFHRHIIGSKGRMIQHLMSKFKVQIHIPPCDQKSDIVTVTGAKWQVMNARCEILRLIERLKGLNDQKEAKNFYLDLSVDPKYHAKLIGRGGTDVNKIKQKYNVQIDFSKKGSPTPDIVRIRGLEENVVLAGYELLNRASELKKLQPLEFHLDARTHSRLIGFKGQNILKVMEEFDVEVKFPGKDSATPTLVVIIGEENKVKDCQRRLETLAEVCLRDIEEIERIKKRKYPSNITNITETSPTKYSPEHTKRQKPRISLSPCQASSSNT